MGNCVLRSDPMEGKRRPLISITGKFTQVKRPVGGRIRNPSTGAGNWDCPGSSIGDLPSDRFARRPVVVIARTVSPS